MINSLKFIKDYDLVVNRESQRRFKTKTITPTQYSREKHPYDVFFLFKKGYQIQFDNINIIVGENGSGKSTLFSLIKRYAGKKPDDFTLAMGNYENEDDYLKKHREDYRGELSIDGNIDYRNSIFYDAETDNPTVAIPKMLNPSSSNFISLAAELFDAQEESHGESLKPILEYLLVNARNRCLFFDEPETALSLKNQIWFAKALIKSAGENQNQIFISTHALAIINQFERVYDMENRRWVNRKRYVNKMLKYE